MLDVPSYILGKKAGGGEGGTSNYNDLSNKPSINGVTLSGNKTTTDLEINIPSIATSISSSSTNTEVAGAKAVYDSLPTIATSISSSSTNTEVAGAKAVYDNSLDVYSTTEHVVGTWIDGRPVYQKVIENTVTLNGAAVAGTINNVKDTISVNWLVTPSDLESFGRAGYLNANYYTGIQAEVNSSNVLTITLFGKEGANSTSTNVRVIVRYTKSTD